jgi:hypothetical protein
MPFQSREKRVANIIKIATTRNRVEKARLPQRAEFTTRKDMLPRASLSDGDALRV